PAPPPPGRPPRIRPGRGLHRRLFRDVQSARGGGGCLSRPIMVGPFHQVTSSSHVSGPVPVPVTRLEPPHATGIAASRRRIATGGSQREARYRRGWRFSGRGGRGYPRGVRSDWARASRRAGCGLSREVSASSVGLLPHSLASVIAARSQIGTDLQGAGIVSQAVGDATLVVSELLTNAILHARPLPGARVLVAWALRERSVE